MKIEYKGLSFEINLSELLENLGDEEIQELLENTLLHDGLMKECIKRIAGKSSNWSGSDSEFAFEFLKTQIFDKCWVWKFNSFETCINKIRDSLFESRLYWKMRRDDNEGNQVFFSNWLEVNGFCESNYCDKEAKQLSEDIGLLFKETFKKELDSCPQTQE